MLKSVAGNIHRQINRRLASDGKWTTWHTLTIQYDIDFLGIIKEVCYVEGHRNFSLAIASSKTVINIKITYFDPDLKEGDTSTLGLNRKIDIISVRIRECVCWILLGRSTPVVKIPIPGDDRIPCCMRRLVHKMDGQVSVIKRKQGLTGL